MGVNDGETKLALEAVEARVNLMIEMLGSAIEEALRSFSARGLDATWVAAGFDGSDPLGMQVFRRLGPHLGDVPENGAVVVGCSADQLHKIMLKVGYKRVSAPFGAHEPGTGRFVAFTARIAAVRRIRLVDAGAVESARPVVPSTASDEQSSESRPGRIDWLIGRVIDSVRNFVAASAQAASDNDEHREKACIFVIDGSDRVAVEFHALCVGAGMGGPPQVKPRIVTTFLTHIEPILGNAAALYDIEDHVEEPLGPDEVRAVVLTLGTLTVVRVGPDGGPRSASPSYGPLRPDVLLGAVACWRNDKPEGFLIKAVFRTRAAGDRFLALYEQHTEALENGSPRREDLEKDLARIKALTPALPSRDVEARVHAEVHWLETRGMLPADDFNGTVFTYGCEMDLENADERLRVAGGPARPLN